MGAFSRRLSRVQHHEVPHCFWTAPCPPGQPPPVWDKADDQHCDILPGGTGSGAIRCYNLREDLQQGQHLSQQHWRGHRGPQTVFRTLQPLVEKLSRSVTSSKVCSSSPDNTLAYLRGLAVVLHEFSYDDTVAPNKQARDMFHKSGNMVSVVVSFLSQLQSQARNFGSVCNNDKSSVTKGVSAVGDMIGSLSDMCSSGGNYKAGVEVRKGADFTSKIAAQIPRLNALNIGFLDCSMKDFNEAAQTMEDIASLVEDIGLERLSNDLGFDF